METLHVYDDLKSIIKKNSGSVSIDDYKDRKPLMLNGYYGVGYHSNPIKIGEVAKLIFNASPVTDGEDLRVEIVRIISIKPQFWNGNDDEYHEETIPSYKNWVKVQFIAE